VSTKNRSKKQNIEKSIIVLFVETSRKFITAKLSIRKPGSSSVLIICDLLNSHALFIFYLFIFLPFYILKPSKVLLKEP
jgi:hypothetical protein